MCLNYYGLQFQNYVHFECLSRLNKPSNTLDSNTAISECLPLINFECSCKNLPVIAIMESILAVHLVNTAIVVDYIVTYNLLIYHHHNRSLSQLIIKQFFVIICTY